MTKKRSQRVAETQAKLIAAARRAFLRDGYARSNMDEFTAEVGLTRGALYHHFGDKKGLLIAVLQQLDQEIDAKIAKKASQHQDAWQKFVAECKTYLELILDPEIQQIMMRDAPAVLGDVTTWPNQAGYIAVLSEQLNTLMDKNIIRSTDANALAHMINGALMHAGFWIANNEDPALALEKSLQALDDLLPGLLKYD